MKTLGSCLTLLMLLWGVVLEASSIKATVDKREILKGESVHLTITVEGEEYEKMPDIPSIAGFPVLRIERSHHSRFTSRNGRSVMILTESLGLEFQPTHDVTIPVFSLKIDGKHYATQPISIKMVEHRAQKHERFVLEVVPHKKEIHLEEPLLVDLIYRAQTGVEVMQLKLKEPEFKDFFLYPIGKEQTKLEKGYTIHQRTFWLLPKKQGSLALSSLSLKVAERNLSGVPIWHEIKSKPVTIKVKPLDQSYDLVGNYQVNTHLDQTETKPNQPVHFSIEIQGVGSLESFKDITYQIDGVTVYEDDANVSYSIVSGELFSHYIKHYVFIAQKDFEIPDIELKGFDYHQAHRYQRTVKGGRVLVDKSEVIAKAEENQTLQRSPLKTDDLNNYIGTSKELLIHRGGCSKTVQLWASLWWLWLLMAFIFGILLTLLAPFVPSIWRQLKVKLYPKVSDEPLFEEGLKVLYPYMSSNKEVEEMVRTLYAHRENRVIKVDKAKLKRMLNYFKNQERLL